MNSKFGNLARTPRKFLHPERATIAEWLRKHEKVPTDLRSAKQVSNSELAVRIENLLRSGRRQKPNFEFTWVYMQAEKQAVYGIIFNEERDEVLLIQRRDIPVWVLPGGGLEQNESPEEGAVREVFEETGLKTTIVRKVAEYLPVNKMTQFSHLYECRAVSGTPSLGPETKNIRFFPLKTLPPLPPPFAGWIADAVTNSRELLRKKIEGVNYWVLVKLLIQHPILVGRYLLTKLGIHINR